MAGHHHHHHPAIMARDDNVKTIVSIIYVTASPTFDGPIGGYVTLSPDHPMPPATEEAETHTHTKEEKHTHTASIPIRSHRPGAGSSGSAVTDAVAISSIPQTSFTTSILPVSSPSSFSLSSSSTFVPARPVVGTPLVSSHVVAASIATVSSIISSSTTPSASTAALISSTAGLTQVQHSNGMSPGAKAGTTIGVLLAVALLAGIAYFFYRRKSGYYTKHDDDFDEKRASQLPHRTEFSSFSIRNSFLKAPRLSLGPLNHVFNTTGDRAEARPSSREESNPFGDHAAAVVDEKRHPMLPTLGPLAEAVVPKPLSIKSGRSSEGSNSSASPAPQNRPSAPKPSNVHRVHIEFKPSMDDELELRPGQLVRMLHAYDDGWALCIRLDRSQQGVVPRQCLSQYPLKPRSGHRVSPAGSRSSMSSYVSNDSVPAPLSPTKNRLVAESATASSDVAHNDTTNSGIMLNETQYAPAAATAFQSVTSPPNTNGLNRKPLPGQAL